MEEEHKDGIQNQYNIIMEESEQDIQNINTQVGNDISINKKNMEEPEQEIQNINIQIENEISIHNKIANWISKKVGTMAFIYILLSIAILWIFINIYMVAIGIQPFDKPFEFQIFLSVSSLIQLFIPMFILISQNIQEKRSRALADQQYKMAKKTKEETKEMFKRLRNLSYNLDLVLSQLKINQQRIIDIEDSEKILNQKLLKEMIDSVNRFAIEFGERPCLIKNS